jgi:hypothetical protein
MSKQTQPKDVGLGDAEGGLVITDAREMGINGTNTGLGKQPLRIE